ncbi:hypothetical protein ZIOFF_033213 [Zingiber officinale]|uniref:Myb/SANT-like domain-containing protein n=1 Tax=Zingiber officinale TaxID=94328 RepID=A0A8J5L6Z6_ZINOF|nr:hypothetical protein ZIOFF_033213 [Zingiber officinale]
MVAKLPSSSLKATPHIESRYKLLKRQFHAITEMLNHSSGVGWNYVEKCIITTKDIFDDWVKSHPAAIGLRNKEFPHLDDLMFVWGKDHATGANAETPADTIEKINLCDEEKPTTRKRKGKADDALDDLVGEIHKYVIAVTEANEEMKRISTYFKKQTESGDRKMKIYDELIELSEFSEQEIIDVREHILKNEHKIDNFFALSKAFRRNYDLFVPSAISLVVPLPLMSLTSEVSGTSEKGANILASEKMAPRGQRVFAVGIGALLFVPVFKAITGLPPYIGILLGLGVLWILTDAIHIGATLH